MKDTRKVDYGTVAYLEKIDLLNGNLLAAHTVWVNDTEVIIVADSMLHSIETKSLCMIFSAFTIISTRISSKFAKEIVNSCTFTPYVSRLTFFIYMYIYILMGFFPK